MDYNENQIEDLQEVKYENLSLQQKLDMMQKLQSKLVSDTKKKPVKMFAPKSFRKDKLNNESNVSSQMNYDLIMEQKSTRRSSPSRKRQKWS